MRAFIREPLVRRQGSHADDTTLMAESEEELKNLLMKVKEESEKVGKNTGVGCHYLLHSALATH